MLKKEFKRKDVDRARNLLTGKSGASSETQVGYEKKRVDYKEGDVWVENKKTWTIKDGIKQSISKMDKIKKEIFMPLCCPKCSKVMKKRLDKPNYKVHKTCFRCVVLKEDKIKREGKWDEYHNGIINNEIDNKIKDFKLWIQDKVEESNSGHVSEDGDVERWVGKVNKEKVDDNIKNVVEYLESLKK